MSEITDQAYRAAQRRMTFSVGSEPIEVWEEQINNEWNVVWNGQPTSLQIKLAGQPQTGQVPPGFFGFWKRGILVGLVKLGVKGSWLETSPAEFFRVMEG